jgi:hypothetical protein
MVVSRRLAVRLFLADLDGDRLFGMFPSRGFFLDLLRRGFSADEGAASSAKVRA